MFNDSERLKAVLGVTPDSLGLTPQGFDIFLESACDLAEIYLSERFDLRDESLRRRAKLAEVDLVRAEMIVSFGLTESIDPTEIQTGGPDGQRVKLPALTMDERIKRAGVFRERAFQIMGGRVTPIHVL